MKRRTIRAAGGVVYRRGPDGAVELLIVHRPRYDDWTLPKGKLDRGETLEEAAVREVEEETGYRCRLGRVAGKTRYRDRSGRSKVVTFYYMTPEAGEFRANREVDRARWLPVDEARSLISYDRDRDLVAAVMAHPPPL